VASSLLLVGSWIPVLEPQFCNPNQVVSVLQNFKSEPLFLLLILFIFIFFLSIRNRIRIVKFGSRIVESQNYRSISPRNENEIGEGEKPSPCTK
ncbi:unnamed protein product, partial [Musa textilis]